MLCVNASTDRANSQTMVFHTPFIDITRNSPIIFTSIDIFLRSSHVLWLSYHLGCCHCRRFGHLILNAVIWLIRQVYTGPPLAHCTAISEDVDTALDNYCHFLLYLWAKRNRKWQKWPKNIYLGKCMIFRNEKKLSKWHQQKHIFGALHNLR